MPFFFLENNETRKTKQSFTNKIFIFIFIILLQNSKNSSKKKKTIDTKKNSSQPVNHKTKQNQQSQRMKRQK